MNGTITNAGTLTIAGVGTEALGGTLTNTGTVDVTGSVTIDLAAYTGTTITNQAGAIFNFQADATLSLNDPGFNQNGRLPRSTTWEPWSIRPDPARPPSITVSTTPAELWKH